MASDKVSYHSGRAALVLLHHPPGLALDEENQPTLPFLISNYRASKPDGAGADSKNQSKIHTLREVQDPICNGIEGRKGNGTCLSFLPTIIRPVNDTASVHAYA